MDAKKRTGLYLDAATILHNPGYLEALRDQIGLNLVIIGFSGELSPAVRAASPFDGTPPSAERLVSILAQHIDGQPSTRQFRSAEHDVGPHVHAGGDDDALRQAIRHAHDAGLEVWLLGAAWTANDFDVLMFCPSKEQNNAWYEAVFTHMAANYGVEGVDITHARFPMTSYPRGMFLCACDDCARSAAAMGYDMAQMIADIRGAQEQIRKLDGRRLAALSRASLGPFDLMQLIGVRPGAIDWFRFRAELLGRNTARFRDAVHAAGGPGFVFLTDTYPASLSMFVGHDHSHWDQFSDCASPLLSHVNIFPMQTLVVWSRFLRGLLPALNEAEALQLVYQLVGYDSLKLPLSEAEFALGEPDCEYRHIPLRDMLALDMAKAKIYLPPEIPSYPIIQGGGAPHLWPREIIEGVMQDAEATGHHGVIFQGTQSLVDFPLR